MRCERLFLWITMHLHAKRNAEIETIRAIAILLVMFRHVHYALPIGIADYPTWLQGTWSGVDLFFVISGYVITGSLLKQDALRQQGVLTARGLLASFYIRRLFRLLPASLLTVALYAACTAWFNASGVFGKLADVGQEAIYILLYVYNFAVPHIGSSLLGWHWSLSLEEQFYLVYPMLFLLLKADRRRLLFFAWIVLLVNLLIRPIYAVYVPAEKYWPLFTTPTFLRMDLLFAGCALALLPVPDWIRRFGSMNRIGMWASLFLVATVAGWMGFRPLLVYPLILIGSVYLVGLAAAQQGFVPTNALLRWIGGRSYALYLMNIPCLYFADEVYFRITGAGIEQASGLPALATALGAHILMVVVAEILYRWVETPMIEYGRSLRLRPTN